MTGVINACALAELPGRLLSALAPRSATPCRPGSIAQAGCMDADGVTPARAR
ncbi:hypothetical protein IU450_24995 [Nocardia abscessus]|uniref:hypothetical protein n=1 Tax=Nocardia abscessus TaxID=120957 RepID=UPI001895CDAD|nr:hypothetical protein [Nocardia abscessus]MBF6339125.1 hypothetical protein [Nocardia abscessus]